MNEKDIKSIEQLIKYLNEQYPYSKDSTNYGEELASMKEMKNVPSMVKKCKRIKYAIRWEPYYFRNEDMLWTYLNKCIVKCCERSNNISRKFFSNAYINVRDVGNADKVKQKLIEIATSRGLDVSESCRKIDEVWGNYFHYKKEISKYSWDSNGYNQILPKIKAVGAWLTDNNYVPNVDCWALLSSESIETTVFYDYLKVEESEYEADEKLRENGGNYAMWGCIAIIVIIVLCIGLAYSPLITIGLIAVLVIAFFVLKYKKKENSFDINKE